MCACTVTLLLDVKLAQRTRAALSADYDRYHYLRDEVAPRLVDRLHDINKSYPVAVEIGTGSGAHVSKLLHELLNRPPMSEEDIAAAKKALSQAQAATGASDSSSTNKPVINPFAVPHVENRGRIDTLHMCETCPAALQRTQEYWHTHASSIPEGRKHEYHLLTREVPLPFEDESADLIISSMHMHWVNDLHGLLRECKRVLKPDGVLLVAMAGGATLQELR